VIRVRSIEDSINSSTEAVKNYESFNNELRFSIFTKETQTFLGIISLKIINKAIVYFEVAYWLKTSQTGKGYMMEDISLIEKYAFNKLNAKRLEIRVAENNIKSINVLKNSSYTYEGRLLNTIQLPNAAVDNALVFGKICV